MDCKKIKKASGSIAQKRANTILNILCSFATILSSPLPQQEKKKNCASLSLTSSEDEIQVTLTEAGWCAKYQDDWDCKDCKKMKKASSTVA